MTNITFIRTPKIGESVKVNDKYAGDYDIVGKTLTVAVVGPQGQVSVKEKFISKSNQNMQYASYYQYSPILFPEEYDYVDYPAIKDKFDADVNVGDYVAVAPAVHGGSIERGIVRSTAINSKYGRDSQAFTLEVDTETRYWESADRKFAIPRKTIRHYGSSAGLLLLQKKNLDETHAW